MSKSSDSRLNPVDNPHHSSPGEGVLELPDPAGFDPCPRRVSPETGLRRCRISSPPKQREGVIRRDHREPLATEFDLITPVPPGMRRADWLDESLETTESLWSIAFKVGR
jgi:hypothetical protein